MGLQSRMRARPRASRVMGKVRIKVKKQPKTHIISSSNWFIVQIMQCATCNKELLHY